MVLTFGYTVPKDEDPIGQVARVFLGENVQVCLNHACKLLNDFLAPLLKADLGRVLAAVGIIGCNGACNGRRIGVSGFHGRLRVNLRVELPSKEGEDQLTRTYVP